MRTGCVCAAKRFCVVVLWTNTCSPIFTAQPIASLLATGNTLFIYYISLWKKFLSFINLHHYTDFVVYGFGGQNKNSDLSVWCFACDAYLDAGVIQQLRPVYETAYILKFGEAPPFRTVSWPALCTPQQSHSEVSSKSSVMAFQNVLTSGIRESFWVVSSLFLYLSRRFNDLAKCFLLWVKYITHFDLMFRFISRYGNIYELIDSIHSLC